jgi:hypothetical protein
MLVKKVDNRVVVCTICINDKYIYTLPSKRGILIMIGTLTTINIFRRVAITNYISLYFSVSTFFYVHFQKFLFLNHFFHIETMQNLDLLISYSF